MSTPRPMTSRPDPAAQPTADAGAWVYGLWAFLFAIPPRVAILGLWIFGDEIGDAFSTGVAVAGFFLAPNTVLAYALLWGADGGVDGAGWIVVAVAALIDLSVWGSLGRLRGR